MSSAHKVYFLARDLNIKLEPEKIPGITFEHVDAARVEEIGNLVNTCMAEGNNWAFKPLTLEKWKYTLSICNLELSWLALAKGEIVGVSLCQVQRFANPIRAPLSVLSAFLPQVITGGRLAYFAVAKKYRAMGTAKTMLALSFESLRAAGCMAVNAIVYNASLAKLLTKFMGFQVLDTKSEEDLFYFQGLSGEPPKPETIECILERAGKRYPDIQDIHLVGSRAEDAGDLSHCDLLVRLTPEAYKHSENEIIGLEMVINIDLCAGILPMIDINILASGRNPFKNGRPVWNGLDIMFMRPGGSPYGLSMRSDLPRQMDLENIDLGAARLLYSRDRGLLRYPGVLDPIVKSCA